jgi:RNA polymerase sigma-70 factor (ECF subfamily)
MTDAALVARARAGEPSAAAALVRRYHADCWRFAYRMLGNRHDAEDVVQETFLRAFRALATYHERERFRSWLFRILANQCRTALLQRRRRARWFVVGDRGERALAEAAADDDGSAASALAEADDLARHAATVSDALQGALARLDPKQREAFLLKHGEGMEYAEIARVTGASVPALKMRVKRACDALRPLLAEAHDG